MKTQIKLVIILLFVGVISIKIFSQQNPFEEYEGIPIIPFCWGAQDFTNYDYSMIKEMGSDFIIIDNVLDQNNFQNIIQGDIKIVPNQALVEPNLITRYTEAAYTKWEAEGEIPTEDDPNYATLVSDQYFAVDYYEQGTKVGIITKWNSSINENEGTIITGPGYSQQVNYRINNDIRNYRSKFLLKLIEEEPNSNPPIEEDNRIICEIIVRAYNTTDSNRIEHLVKVPIQIKDLSTNEWTNHEILYNLSNLPSGIYQTIPGENDTIMFISDFLDGGFLTFVKYVDFEVKWYKTNGYRLALDNIICYDSRGYELLVFKTVVPQIIKQIDNTIINTPFLPMSDYWENVYGWYAIDEPHFIDNMEPIRFIDSLVRAVTENAGHPMKLWQAQAGCWAQSFGSIQMAPINTIKYREFNKRAKFDGVILNYYVFREEVGGPKMPLSLHKIELTYMNNNLKLMSELDENFIFSVQNGKWLSDPEDEENDLKCTPTPIQYNYLVNNALLFGAKGIDIMNYFIVYKTGIANEIRIGGMYDPVLDEYTELYDFTKNTLYQRLSGLFGKTLKTLQQRKQYADVTFAVLSNEIITNIDFKPPCDPSNAPGYKLGYDLDSLNQKKINTILCF